MINPDRPTVAVVLAKGGGAFAQRQLVDYVHQEPLNLVLIRNPEHGFSAFDPLADAVIDVDVYDAGTLVTEVARFHERTPVDAVLTVNEFSVVETALVVSALGLRGPSVQAAQRCRNKYLARRAVAERGIDQPRFALIGEPAELSAAAEYVGYPVIVKPVNHGGSSLIYRLDDAAAVASMASRLVALRKDSLANEFFPDSLQKYWIVEEYARGFEVCVECVVAHGVNRTVAIHDKIVPNDSIAYLEPFAMTPSGRIDASLGARIEALSTEILSAIGFDNGVAHLEFHVDGDRLNLIEVNGRTGGSLITESVLHSTGVNLGECLVNVALGRPLPVQQGSTRATGFVQVFADRPGRIAKIHGVEEVRSAAGLVMFDQELHEGDVIPQGMTEFAAIALFEGPSPQTLVDRLLAAQRALAFDMVEP